MSIVVYVVALLLIMLAMHLVVGWWLLLPLFQAIREQHQLDVESRLDEMRLRHVTQQAMQRLLQQAREPQ